MDQGDLAKHAGTEKNVKTILFQLFLRCRNKVKSEKVILKKMGFLNTSCFFQKKMQVQKLFAIFFGPKQQDALEYLLLWLGVRVHSAGASLQLEQ